MFSINEEDVDAGAASDSEAGPTHTESTHTYGRRRKRRRGETAVNVAQPPWEVDSENTNARKIPCSKNFPPAEKGFPSSGGFSPSSGGFTPVVGGFPQKSPGVVPSASGSFVSSPVGILGDEWRSKYGIRGGSNLGVGRQRSRSLQRIGMHSNGFTNLEMIAKQGLRSAHNYLRKHPLLDTLPPMGFAMLQPPSPRELGDGGEMPVRCVFCDAMRVCAHAYREGLPCSCHKFLCDRGREEVPVTCMRAMPRWF